MGNIVIGNTVKFAETTEERRAAYQLRYKLYFENMHRCADISDHINKELRDPSDEYGRIIISTKNNEARGTLRLLWGADRPFNYIQTENYNLSPLLSKVAAEKICIIERLMVDKQSRQSMTLLQMYNLVMQFILKNKIEAVVICAEAHYFSSYLKQGFRHYAKPYNNPGLGPTTPMVWVVGDYEHLLSVGSPYAALVSSDQLEYCRHTKFLVKTVHQEFLAAQPFISAISDLPDTSFVKDTDPTIFQRRLKLKLLAA